MRKLCTARISIYLLFVLCFSVSGDTPHWIWRGNQSGAIQPDEACFLRKTFRVETRPEKALLSIAADDEATVYINGHQVAQPKGYDKPTTEDVTRDIKTGENIIAF